MITVLTIPDLVVFLISLSGRVTMAMLRSRHSTLGILVSTCLVTMALTIFLSYRCVQISRLRNPYILEDLSYQSKDLYNQLSDSSAALALTSSMPPITVHYMWCRKSHFEYKHYLSLLSVAKVLRPDQIVVHYLELPLMDRKGYFTWFDDIQREIAMLSLKQLRNPRHCSHDFSKGVAKSEDFPNNNGVFMMEDVAISNLTREAFYLHTGAEKLAKNLCQEEQGGEDGACQASERKAAQLFLVPASEPYHLTPGEGRVVFECPTIEAFNKANVTARCLQLSQRLFPSDIWRRNKTFERFARRMAFNDPDPVTPIANPDRAAPNIAHILSLGGEGEEALSPLCYNSIQSAVAKGKVGHVFVHGNVGSGKKEENRLWRQLLQQYPDSISHVPTPSFSGDSSSVGRDLLYGLYVLIQYGGVLSTCDTLFQKPLEPLLLYPALSTVQKSMYRIVHHHVDFSVLVARPGSEFLQSLIPVVKQMVETGSDRDHGAVAYHVFEQYPSTVVMETDLTGHLACRGQRCLPKEGQQDVRQAYAVKFTWVEGAQPETLNLFNALSTPLVKSA